MLQASFLILLLAAPPEKPFAITVIDDRTNRGVPLIELRTVHGIRLFTDSNGIVAFNEPGLMKKTVFFHVSGHGYEHAKDAFGFRGKQIQIEPGGTATIKVTRINIAERLYRVTGGGIYRDSLLVGTKIPLSESGLNGQVIGSDSVMNAVYRGKIYWFWGDTNWPGYPLGNFHVPGATSELPTNGGLSPEAGVNLSYFVDEKGFAKKTCEMPGKGPTWVETLVTLRDKAGRERLLAEFVKIDAPLAVYARGLAVFNDEKQKFEKVRDLDVASPCVPRGHAVRHKDADGDFVYFAHPYPLTRVLATAEAFGDPAQYECYTCLKTGTKIEDQSIERDAEGKICYTWKKNTPAVGPPEQAKLIAAGKMKATESPIRLVDRDSGKAVTAHGGSVYWNEYRKRWVMVAVEHFGKASLLGEVWYAEAERLVGPWRHAVKVVTHEKYSFYNPKQHPMFDREGGKYIYFEGTYTHTFSGNSNITPRYDYNQVMYRLDLSDPRLVMPKP